MKSILKILIPVLILTVNAAYGQKQNPESEKVKIEGVIVELFNAYRAGDSARVAATFTQKAIIQSIHRNKEGEITLSEPVPVTKLIQYIGGGLSEVHDERIWDTEIFHDQFMATVWTKYAFYLGKNLTHCGTEVFNLRKIKGDWKIFYLADTRQLEGCNVPASVK